KGANIDEKDREGKTAFAFAVEKGKEAALYVLVQNGVNPNKVLGHQSPLGIALENNDMEVARVLLDAGAKPVPVQQNSGIYASAYKGELLIEAAKFGDRENVTLLLAQGANVNTKDKDGNTALMYAAKIENGESIVTS